ncbi:hypothetical protein [Herbiconiux liukaitaii]|uniref:hypothetical protein n=1 Tax=Herbiconiux liukaitaii TaxID=3342799 RepID=UPI0035BAAABD
MNDRITRVTRGLVAAAVATFVAAFSHVVAGGGAPGAAGSALAVAFAVLVCVALAGRRLRDLSLTLSVVLSQFVFHLLFGVGGGGAAVSHAGAEVAGHAGHGADAAQLAALLPEATSGMAHSESPWMWFSHAVAAVVTIVALRRGELTLRRLGDLGRVHLAAVPRATAIFSVFAAYLRAARIALGLDPTVGVLPRPGRARSADPASAVADLLRDLVVLTGGLRHRGPPRAGSALLAPSV